MVEHDHDRIFHSLVGICVSIKVHKCKGTMGLQAARKGVR